LPQPGFEPHVELETDAILLMLNIGIKLVEL